MQQEMIRSLVSDFMDEVESGSDTITALISILETNFTSMTAEYTTFKELKPINNKSYTEHIKKYNLHRIGEELADVAAHEVSEDGEYEYHTTDVVVWKGEK